MPPDATIADTDGGTVPDGSPPEGGTVPALDSGTLASLAHLQLTGDAPILAMSSRGNLIVLGRAKAPGPTPELVVVRSRTPDEAVVIGSLDLDADVRAVAIEGTRVYAATSDDARELAIVDVADPTSPVITGGFDALGVADATSLDAAGTRVVLGRKASSGPELMLLDTTDPVAVVELASGNIAADVNGIDTNAFVAYVATSDPNAQLEIFNYGQLGPAVGPWRFNTWSGEVGRAIDVNEQHIYLVTAGNGVGHLWELAAPWNTIPTYLDAIRFDREPTTIVRFGGRALVGFRDGGVSVIGGLDQQSFNALVPPPTGPIADGGAGSFPIDADAGVGADAGSAEPPLLPTPHVQLKQGALTIEGSYPSLGDVRALGVRDDALTVAGSGSVSVYRTSLVPAVVDRNADGFRSVSALGDSNTKRADTLPTWVDDLPALLPAPGWRFTNRAAPFSALTPTLPVPNATRQLDLALAQDAPDAVVVAFGSNDASFINAIAISGGHLPTEISIDPFASGLLGLRARSLAAGVPAFIALQPPRNEVVQGELEQLICEMNHRVRNDFDPALVVDFFSTMSAPGDYLDEIHLGPTGQEKRAMEVARKLEP